MKLFALALCVVAVSCSKHPAEPVPVLEAKTPSTVWDHAAFARETAERFKGEYNEEPSAWLSGSGVGDSETFRVAGSEQWFCWFAKDNVPMMISAVDANGLRKIVGASQARTSAGDFTAHLKPGQYHLKVTSMEPWVVLVYDRQ